MADFYRRWAGSGNKLSKAEALRDAQLDLLLRRTKTAAAVTDRGLIEEDPKPSVVPGDYSHPFYWAPFILTGNWQ